jgi:hypothetical protein
MGASATDLAIRIAKREGHLELVEKRGRFGPFVSIRDRYGIIETADNMDAAQRRVQECCQ